MLQPHGVDGPRLRRGDDHRPAALTFLPLRGCSDFLFVPGTNDTHVFAIRTEETIDGSGATFVSVVDLEAKVLMPEKLLAKDRKFEGTCLIDDWATAA